MPALTKLDLSNNSLEGPLPAWGGPGQTGLGALLYFYFRNTSMEATLPASWANLANLTYLDAFQSRLRGRTLMAEACPSLSSLQHHLMSITDSQVDWFPQEQA